MNNNLLYFIFTFFIYYQINFCDWLFLSFSNKKLYNQNNKKIQIKTNILFL